VQARTVASRIEVVAQLLSHRELLSHRDTKPALDVYAL